MNIYFCLVQHLSLFHLISALCLGWAQYQAIAFLCPIDFKSGHNVLQQRRYAFEESFFCRDSCGTRDQRLSCSSSVGFVDTTLVIHLVDSNCIQGRTPHLMSS
jgi:hypothetical protein